MTNPDASNGTSNNLWSAEKEDQIIALEQRLEDANKRWKEEQEEIAGPVSRHRERHP